jgi:hypothetical protein
MPRTRLSRLFVATTISSLSAFAGFLSTVQPATAEVRFGKNVRIGGHDVSNQTFNSRRRGEYYIYKNNPPNPGCHWRRNGDGSKTKVCHLKRKPH